jgi:long-chain acyl-CoA synthetase
MQQVTGVGQVEISPSESLTASLWRSARDRPDRPAVAYRSGDRFLEWTTLQFVEEVRAVARGLLGLGIEAGQRVCIYSGTRLEWTVLDYAIWSIGGVAVPIYETSAPEQVEWIVADAQAVAIVVEDAQLLGQYETVADRLPSCEHVFVFERAGLEQIKDAGRGVADEELQRRADAVTGADIATIVYTSGTTGRPKGCVLTHGNLVFNAAATEVALPQLLGSTKTTLLFLPLAHVFSRMIAVVCIRSGVLLAFSTGIPHLQEELAMVRPSFLFAVPRVFEKIVGGARKKAHDAGRGRIFDRAMAVAEQSSRERASGSVRLATRLQHRLFDRLVFRKLRDAMGGRVEYAISGGAALGEHMGHLFAGLGITILEGYGLTETTAPAVGNRPDALRHGTVGRPMPGVSVRLAADGEIEIKGGNVFAGYLGNEQATREVLDADGWLRTGDLGMFDEAGFLRITGRKKEIIVTAGGKNVAPAGLEDRLRSHLLVSHAMVVGDGQPFIGALVAVDLDELSRWADRTGKSASTIGQLARDRDLHRELQDAVDAANGAVSKAERIREFRVIPGELTVEGGELTPTMKVKRDVIAERYRALIEDIYDRSRVS